MERTGICCPQNWAVATLGQGELIHLILHCTTETETSKLKFNAKSPKSLATVASSNAHHKAHDTGV